MKEAVSSSSFSEENEIVKFTAFIFSFRGNTI